MDQFLQSFQETRDQELNRIQELELQVASTLENISRYALHGARIQELQLQVASTLENISRYTRSQDTRTRAPGCIYTREYIQVNKELGYKNQSSRLHLHLRIYPGIKEARIQELELQVASTLENISRYTRSQDTRTRAPGCIYTREYIQVYKELGYKNQSFGLHLNQ